MKKRIVFFDGSLEQGGAEKVISLLSKRMSVLGYSVEIVLFYDRSIFYEIDSSVKITSIEREVGKVNVFLAIFWLRKYFEKNADIVISFLAPFNIFALIAHLGLKMPIIVSDRNDPYFVPTNRVIRKLRDIIYLIADGVVVQTSHNMDYFCEKIKMKGRVIFNPIDLADKRGIALKTEKKKEIVSVGRIVPQKNQECLIKAFAIVHSIYPEYKLVIYGDKTSKEYLLKLEKLISDLSLVECVDLPGKVKDVVDRISEAEVFVLSSNYEGMPNALIEAMCVGLPCVSTKVSGANDFIQHEENGELIEINDFHGLADSLLRLLKNADIRNEYGKNAVLLNDKLNLEIIMNEWIDYLSKYM